MQLVVAALAANHTGNRASDLGMERRWRLAEGARPWSCRDWRWWSSRRRHKARAPRGRPLSRWARWWLRRRNIAPTRRWTCPRWWRVGTFRVVRGRSVRRWPIQRWRRRIVRPCRIGVVRVRGWSNRWWRVSRWSNRWWHWAMEVWSGYGRDAVLAELPTLRELACYGV